MRVVKHKWFWVWSFEKEEKWLNEMSAKGLQLVGTGFCRYTFDEGPRGEYQYRLELLEKPPHHYQSASYLQFLEETGVEHIGSLFRWVYLRKKASEGPFKLFSDIDSRITHVKRIFTLLVCLLPLQISSLTINISNAARGITASYILVGVLGLITLLLGYGCARLGIELQRLKKERILHE